MKYIISSRDDNLGERQWIKLLSCEPDLGNNQPSWMTSSQRVLAENPTHARLENGGKEEDDKTRVQVKMNSKSLVQHEHSQSLLKDL